MPAASQRIFGCISWNHVQSLFMWVAKLLLLMCPFGFVRIAKVDSSYQSYSQILCSWLLWMTGCETNPENWCKAGWLVDWGAQTYTKSHAKVRGCQQGVQERLWWTVLTLCNWQRCWTSSFVILKLILLNVFTFLTRRVPRKRECISAVRFIVRNITFCFIFFHGVGLVFFLLPFTFSVSQLLLVRPHSSTSFSRRVVQPFGRSFYFLLICVRAAF